MVGAALNGARLFVLLYRKKQPAIHVAIYPFLDNPFGN